MKGLGKYDKLINSKKGTKIPILGMMGEGEITKVNPPTRTRPYGSITVKATSVSKANYESIGEVAPKQETYDLVRIHDHVNKIKPNFSEVTWTRENIEYFKNYKKQLCNQTLSYR
jgi:hypothetical protein